MLYTARIEHPGKGHTALIDAWSHWGNKTPHAPQLVFAGAACERSDEVIAYAKQRGVKVLYTGFVPDHLLAELYRACRTFVFPSRYEGFGLPPLEAMACGAVVASSRAAALAETAGPAAELDPDDPEGMADTIRRCNDDEPYRAQLRQAGMAWAQQFTWERCAREVVQVYAHVLGHIHKPVRGDNHDGSGGESPHVTHDIIRYGDELRQNYLSYDRRNYYLPRPFSGPR